MIKKSHKKTPFAGKYWLLILAIALLILGCENPVEVKTLKTYNNLQQQVYHLSSNDQNIDFKESPGGRILGVLNVRRDVGYILMQAGFEDQSWQQSPPLQFPPGTYDFFDYLPLSGRGALYSSPDFYSIDFTTFELDSLPLTTDRSRLSFAGKVAYQNQDYDLCTVSMSQKKFFLYNSQTFNVTEVYFSPGLDLLYDQLAVNSLTHIQGTDTLFFCGDSQVFRFSLSNQDEVSAVLNVGSVNYQNFLQRVFVWSHYLITVARDSIKVYDRTNFQTVQNGTITFSQYILNFAGVNENTVFINTTDPQFYYLLNCQSGELEEKQFPYTSPNLTRYGRVGLDASTGNLYALSNEIDQRYIDFVNIYSQENRESSKLNWPEIIYDFDWLDNDAVVFATTGQNPGENDLLLKYELATGYIDTLISQIDQAGLVKRAGDQIVVGNGENILRFYGLSGVYQYEIELPHPLQSLEYNSLKNLCIGFGNRDYTVLMEWIRSESPEVKTTNLFGYPGFEKFRLIPLQSPLFIEDNFQYSFLIGNDAIYIFDEFMERSKKVRDTFVLATPIRYLNFRWTFDGKAVYSRLSVDPQTIFREQVWIGP